MVGKPEAGKPQAGKPAAGQANPNAKLTVGLGVGLSSLDPARDANAQALSLFLHVYDPLVLIGDDLQTKPGLAESWKIVDSTAWEFKLRKNATWHNGEPFTAQDVKFSIERLKDPELKSPAAPFVASVDRVDVADDATVIVRTKEPYAPLDRRLGMVPILPMKVVQQLGNDEFAKKMTTMYGGMNTNEKPLDDVRVRKAINHAIDVDKIMKELLLGAATRSTQPLQPGLLGYNPDIKPYTYDPERSKALLREAGYPNGVELPMEIYEGRYLKDREVTQVIAADLEKVGFKVNLRPTSYAGLIQAYSANQVPGLYLQGALNPPVDPDHVLPLFLTSRGRGYYKNAETDPLIWQAAGILDPAQRDAAYKAVMPKLVEDAPWFFLYNVEDIYGVNKRVTWEPRKDSRIIVSGAEVR